MALQLDATPELQGAIASISESTRLMIQENSKEKDAAVFIADKALSALDGHESTKKLLLIQLRGIEDNEAFSVESSRRKAEKNCQNILKGMKKMAEKKNTSFEKVKEALLMSLEIDALQAQFTQQSYEALVPADNSALERAIKTKNIKLLVSELNYHPILKDEVLKILEDTKELQTGVIGIRRMPMSTEARKIALEIYNAEMIDDLLVKI